jgi:hypothetical protein
MAMEKLNILMLGWEDPDDRDGEQEAWLPRARALAGQVKLNVALPRHHPPVTLNNIIITDLGSVDLPVRSSGAIAPENLPFAPIPFPAPTIPLYGTPVYTGRDTGKREQRLPGEALRTGHAQQAAEWENRNKMAVQKPPPSLHAQVIEYARKACRFAHRLNFDGIYAFHWQTYLAALELKLVTRKRIALQVHALSRNRHFPDRLGWMLEVEKQAFEKADALLLDEPWLAEDLNKEYGFAVAKASVTGHHQQAVETLFRVFSRQPSGLNNQ